MVLLLVTARSAVVAADDPNDILKRFFEAERKNWEKASRYTHVEQKDDYSFEKDGTSRKDRSQTHEVIFVEGETYRKLVARRSLAVARMLWMDQAEIMVVRELQQR